MQWAAGVSSNQVEHVCVWPSLSDGRARVVRQTDDRDLRLTLMRVSPRGARRERCSGRPVVTQKTCVCVCVCVCVVLHQSPPRPGRVAPHGPHGGRQRAARQLLVPPGERAADGARAGLRVPPERGALAREAARRVLQCTAYGCLRICLAACLLRRSETAITTVAMRGAGGSAAERSILPPNVTSASSQALCSNQSSPTGRAGCYRCEDGLTWAFGWGGGGAARLPAAVTVHLAVVTVDLLVSLSAGVKAAFPIRPLRTPPYALRLAAPRPRRTCRRDWDLLGYRYSLLSRFAMTSRRRISSLLPP